MQKITGIEEEIRQPENRRRQLVQEQKAQERRDRTKRPCRMGLFESLFPDTIPLTEEPFRTFPEKTAAASHARIMLTMRPFDGRGAWGAKHTHRARQPQPQNRSNE